MTCFWVFGSLHFTASGCRLADFIAEGLVLSALSESVEFLLTSVCRAFQIILWHCLDTEMSATGRQTAGLVSTLRWSYRFFWNALGAYVNLDSDGIYELMTIPDVLGLHFRLPGVAVIKVLLGQDSRSVRVLVPDPRVNDRGFHDVTLVDMSDTAGPDVSVANLSLLRLQWPVSIVNSLSWL